MSRGFVVFDVVSELKTVLLRTCSKAKSRMKASYIGQSTSQSQEPRTWMHTDLGKVGAGWSKRPHSPVSCTTRALSIECRHHRRNKTTPRLRVEVCGVCSTGPQCFASLPFLSGLRTKFGGSPEGLKKGGEGMWRQVLFSI